MRRLKTVRRPPIYRKSPGHLPCSSLTHPLPLPSRRPSVSFGGFGLRNDSPVPDTAHMALVQRLTGTHEVAGADVHVPFQLAVCSVNQVRDPGLLATLGEPRRTTSKNGLMNSTPMSNPGCGASGSK